jgi:hypothetical protein
MAHKGYVWYRKIRDHDGTITDFSVSCETLHIAWNEDQYQGLLQATSEHGSLYDGSYFYKNDLQKIGKTSLRRYEAQDGSLLFFGSYTEHNGEQGLWAWRIEKQSD